jgi:hypothetical protein
MVGEDGSDLSARLVARIARAERLRQVTISLSCSVDSFTAARIGRRPGRTPLGWGVHIRVVSNVSRLLHYA